MQEWVSLHGDVGWNVTLLGSSQRRQRSTLSLSLHAGLKHLIEIGLSSSRLLIKLLFERQHLQKKHIKFFKKKQYLLSHRKHLQVDLKYLFFEASDPLSMCLLPALQSLLCLKLTVSQTLRLHIQLLVVACCHLQEAVCVSMLWLGDVGLRTIQITLWDWKHREKRSNLGFLCALGSPGGVLWSQIVFTNTLFGRQLLLHFLIYTFLLLCLYRLLSHPLTFWLLYGRHRLSLSLSLCHTWMPQLYNIWILFQKPQS